MGKKLLLFSDGTGNSSAKAEKTNVWRLFQAVDQTLPDQLARYDDGVGTSRNKYLAAIGGAFGYGLKRNVIDLYEFVCRNHRDGDEISAFGFSRGAFTIRMLVGLIANQGLVPFRSEEELHANAVLAYRRFRSERFTSRSPFVWLARHLRDAVLWPFTRRADAALKAARRDVPIRFIGLWDTVAAYGMPIDELKWGISLLIWPMVSADRKLSPLVQQACHALALDDQRETFHPILFDESDEPSSAEGDASKRISQVWFAGMHSNVGGGYPEDGLALVSLDWMMSQLRGTGVRFDDSVLTALAEDRSAFAKLYDSRAGIASYYRYSPRGVDMGVDGAGRPVRAVVHGSVVMRMACGSDAYAPISLPDEFDVLAPDGTLLPMRGFAADRRARAAPPAGAPATTVGDPRARTDALVAAIATMNPAQGPSVDAEMVRQVRDSVWLRRVAYFACLFATLCVVAFPLAAGLYSRSARAVLTSIPGIGSDLWNGIVAASRWFTPVWRGWTADLFGAIGSFVPSWAQAWLEALAEQPLQMLLALAFVALFFAMGQFLARRIHDRAWFAWHPAHRADYLHWAIESAHSSRSKAVGLLVGTAVLYVAALLNAAWTPAIRHALLLLTVLMVGVTIWRVRIVRRLDRDRAAIAAGAQALPATPTLRVARFMRTEPRLIALYRVLSDRVIPLLFAAALAYAVVGACYHLVVRGASSAGAWCADATGGAAASARTFDTAHVCWASGLHVDKGASYEVVLTTAGDWLDDTLPADAAGVKAPTAALHLAVPMRRSWSARWYQPIVRVGVRGDDEHPMTAVGPARAAASVRFTAEHAGDLFLYVNDAILLVPGRSDFFYRNNHGTATVSLCRLEVPAGGRLADATCPGSAAPK